MAKVKIEKDVYVKDRFGVRRRAFVAGTEVDELKYNEVFRLSVPVAPEELPKVPEFIGTEELNGKILKENKSLFVPEEKADEKVAPKAKAEAEVEVEEESEVKEPVKKSAKNKSKDKE